MAPHVLISSQLLVVLTIASAQLTITERIVTSKSMLHSVTLETRMHQAVKHGTCLASALSLTHTT